MTYARGTDVTVDRSQQEIVRILHRYNVEEYAFGATRTTVALNFRIGDSPVRMVLPVPPRPDSSERKKAGNGRWVSLLPAWEQEVKETWRALALVLKANLELVERNAVTVEQAFMAFLLMPGEDITIGERVLPLYAKAIADNKRLLLEGRS